MEEAIAAAGPRLQQLRRSHRLTLTDVAERTGISKSTLSRLESGQRRASLELLLPLAKIYQVTLDNLVNAPASGDPRINLRPVRRDGATLLPLTRRPGGIQAFKIVLEAGGSDTPDLRTHEGYEWLYVLNGRLRLMLGGHDLVLRPGEAAEFDTRTPIGSERSTVKGPSSSACSASRVSRSTSGRDRRRHDARTAPDNGGWRP